MKMTKILDRPTVFIFLSSVVIMLIAHGFCFMNLMFSHDSLAFCSPQWWS